MFESVIMSEVVSELCMKKMILSVMAFTILLSITGCQGLPDRESDSRQQDFPTKVTGTWKAQDNPWEITLSPEGKVEWAVIPMGGVKIKPNETTEVEMKDGSISTYRAGDCDVKYAPDNRMLFVEIRVEDIHIKFMDNVIDGNRVDTFIGPVFEDGKIWDADWVSKFDYGPRFPQDPNEIVAVPLRFEKVQ